MSFDNKQKHSWLLSLITCSLGFVCNALCSLHCKQTLLSLHTLYLITSCPGPQCYIFSLKVLILSLHIDKKCQNATFGYTFVVQQNLTRFKINIFQLCLDVLILFPFLLSHHISFSYSMLINHVVNLHSSSSWIYIELFLVANTV